LGEGLPIVSCAGTADLARHAPINLHAILLAQPCSRLVFLGYMAHDTLSTSVSRFWKSWRYLYVDQLSQFAPHGRTTYLEGHPFPSNALRCGWGGGRRVPAQDRLRRRGLGCCHLAPRPTRTTNLSFLGVHVPLVDDDTPSSRADW